MRPFFGPRWVDYKLLSTIHLVTSNFFCKTLDVKKIMKESRNEHELRHIWAEWHNKCGNQVKKSYEEFVSLSNQAARLNSLVTLIFIQRRLENIQIWNLVTDYSDTGAFWLREYELDTIKEDFQILYDTLAPLYKQLHAYARSRLRNVYGDQFSSDGLIPAHLLGSNLEIAKNKLPSQNYILNSGNVAASRMDGINSLLIPYPDKAPIDVTDEMKKQVRLELI